MLTFAKVHEVSKSFVKLDHIDIESMVHMLAIVVKAVQKPPEIKAHEVWIAMEQHLGTKFFLQVIADNYGLDPNSAQSLMGKLETDISNLKDWCKD